MKKDNQKDKNPLENKHLNKVLDLQGCLPKSTNKSSYKDVLIEAPKASISTSFTLPFFK